MESCGMNFIKHTLFIFNLIFAISGIGIIIVGALVLGNVGDFYNVMESRMLTPPVVLIVTGAIIFLIAFLGCFGAIRESHTMLISFAVGLLIIFVLELAVGIAAACYSNDFQNGLKLALKASIKNYTTLDSERKTWDNIQQKFMCCGVDDSSDWQGQTIPASCCRDKQNLLEIESPYCKTFQSSENYMSTVGCYEQIELKVQSNVKCLIGVGIGIAFIEIVGIIFACWLAVTIRKREK